MVLFLSIIAILFIASIALQTFRSKLQSSNKPEVSIPEVKYQKPVIKPTSVPRTQNMVKISVSELERKRLGFDNNEIMDLMTSAIMTGQKYVYVPAALIETIDKNVIKLNLRDQEWSTLYKMKQKAQGLEKSGNLPEAFLAFKELISFASNSKTLTSNNYSHDINRLRIISNKLKRKSEYESFMAGITFRP